MANDNTSNTATSAATVIRNEAQRDKAQAPRVRPANLGGPNLKLSVIGTIPGFHLYWANDNGEGAIEQLLTQYFEFALPSEVGMNPAIVADSDVGGKVSRYVGQKADGTPMRAYLMKCPDEVWDWMQEDRAALADNWDADIRRGQVEPDANRYVPKGHEISLDTRFRKQY